MRLLDFIENAIMPGDNIYTQAAKLCYYDYKENGKEHFTKRDVQLLLLDSGLGLHVPEKIVFSMELMKKYRLMKPSQDDDQRTGKPSKASERWELIPVTMDRYDRDYAHLWRSYVQSDSELIDEETFCGKRGYLDQLILQINCCYSSHCYDACAVLMRRLIEILLIMAYEKLGIADAIRDNRGDQSGYKTLNSIVKDAMVNRDLNLSRHKHYLNDIRELGNYSAHNIYYTANLRDIDHIRTEYRVIIEELYYKAGLL